MKTGANHFQAWLQAIVLRNESEVCEPEIDDIVAHKTPAYLLFALLIASIGQIAFSIKIIWLGILLYGIAAIFTFLHILCSESSNPPKNAIRKRTEMIILIFIIVIAVFSRFYLLMDKPYGYEADGARVAGHTYFAYFAHEPGEMDIHFDSQPTAFFMQYLAMLIGGISFTSTRVLSASMGSLSVFLFFFILRRLSGSFTALYGTFFYAVGFTALYAARQTHIETAIEFWVLLTYFLLIEAIHRKKRIFLFLSSLSTIAGMLCFESYYMTPIIVVSFLIWITFKEKQKIIALVKDLAFYILPMLPIVPLVYEYSMKRADYHFEPMEFHAAGFNLSPFLSKLAFMWVSFLESMQTLFYEIRYTDSLLIWPGPMINPILLPLFVIGFILIISKFKKNSFIFLAIWFVLQYFPFAVLGAPYPRVLYPGLIPVYGLAAFGLFAIIQSISKFNWQYSSIFISFLLLLFTGSGWFIDQNIFWTKVFDPEGRQKRHEQSDLIMEGLQTSPVLYLPYIPNTIDDIPKDKSINNMSAGAVVGPEHVHDALHLLPMSELLAAISTDKPYTSVSFLFEKHAVEKVEQRQMALSTLATCYPEQSVQNGRFFDLITIYSLNQNVCYSLYPATLIGPGLDLEPSAAVPITFIWQFSSENSLSYQIAIEQKPPAAIWIEAEIMTDHGGWFKDTIFVDDYSGIGYLTDSWQSTETDTFFTVKESETYHIWVKSYKRVSNDQQNFLAIDHQNPLPFASGGEDVFYKWIWEDIGQMELIEGEHDLTLSRTYGNDNHFQVFIDEIAISSDPDFNPNLTAEWQPGYQTETLPNAAVQSFDLPQTLEPGHYRWNLTLIDGDQLVDWQGNVGVTSPFMEFIISR
ncbi:MAG: glycosyltransferase family 39 protein [Anaerolineaceae bacterium]|nr:glycosyltransferase family 39 protein [Anaerolineaceae bacterium]